MDMEQWSNDDYKGENEEIRRKSCPSATFCYLGTEPEAPNKKPTPNPLNYDIAKYYAIFKYNYYYFLIISAIVLINRSLP
jgi:hypothetical protein